MTQRQGKCKPQTTANIAKYDILEQTGMAALAQANSMDQAVLALLR
jgi:flagellin-like hook-associated protein FlgL